MFQFCYYVNFKASSVKINQLSALRIITLALFSVMLDFAFPANLHAQDQEELEERVAKIQALAKDSNFYHVYDEYMKLLEEEEPTTPAQENDGPKEQFERWAHFMAQRVDAQGRPPRPDIVYQEWLKHNDIINKGLSKKNTWQYLGPLAAPQNNGGVGRVNCVTIDPTNTNTLWAGAPSGGLWKSTDGGAHWSSNTDNLPVLGVTDIVINYRNTDTMLIATGDGYGYGLPNGNIWGGTYSMGVMLSTDGGQSWKQTGMNWTLTQSKQIYKLLMHPKNPNIVYAATSNGVWKSDDCGQTWALVMTASAFDIEFNPSNPDIIYASGVDVYVSKDKGANWLQTSTFSGMVSTVLAVTKSKPNIVYALTMNAGTGAANSQVGTVYKSSDNGKTWRLRGSISATKFSGYYATAFNVSPVDSNKVYAAGLNITSSSDGGVSWTQLTKDFTGFFGGSLPYVHPDHRVLIFYPNDARKIINANDGGIYQTNDGGQNWAFISDEVKVLQTYRIGSAYNVDLFFTGAQDNGINRQSFGSWDHVLGGDGMTCVVDYTDGDVVYALNQYGAAYKSTDGGNSFGRQINPNNRGDWVAPFLISPQNHNALYYGSTGLFKSLNGGVYWSNITRGLSLPAYTYVTHVAVSKTDTNSIYFTAGYEFIQNSSWVWHTTDGGKKWTSISAGLPTGVVIVSDIAADPVNPQTVYITYGGYRNGEKVFKSTDGGSTWTNFSGKLPNYPINCITMENSQDEGVYVGTDAGVFYRNNSTDWMPYNDGLPNVIINQLEMVPAAGKIRAATYGRGIWEGDVAGKLNAIQQMEAFDHEISVFPNPATDVLKYRLPQGVAATPTIRVMNALGAKVAEIQSNKSGINSGSYGTISLEGVPSGIYLVNFEYPTFSVSKKVQIIK
jgi:photosystem II stability/assembly factor-like uncharacterized protein